MLSLEGLAEELEIISPAPRKVPAESTLYISHIHTEPDANGYSAHTIVVVHIVIENNASNGIYNTLNFKSIDSTPAGNLKIPTRPSLTILCDTLEIRSPLVVPEHDVTICARRLIFSGEGLIDTTPLKWTPERATEAIRTGENKGTVGQPGIDGRHAGNFRVLVEEISIPAGDKHRFIARGGDGQQPGIGRTGERGKPIHSIREHVFQNLLRNSPNFAEINFDPPATYVKYTWWGVQSILWEEDLHTGYLGTLECPSNGEHALSPGVPGGAGDGGEFLTNQKSLASLVQNEGGKAADSAPDVAGGVAGTPERYAHYDIRLESDHRSRSFPGRNTRSEVKMIPAADGGNIRTTQAGNDIKAPQLPKNKSKIGKQPPVKTDAATNAWLHPLMLPRLLSYARDTILGGDAKGILPLLNIYHAVLASGTPPSQDTTWGDALRAVWQGSLCEITTLIERIRANLDYYGNPAGYMPLLSLRSTMQVYEDEIRHALRALLLAHWVEKREEENQKSLKSAGVALSLISESNANLTKELRNQCEQMKKLSESLLNVESRQHEAEKELTQLKLKLTAQATNDERARAQQRVALKAASFLLQAIPEGQPALGIIGKGVISLAEEEDTFDTHADTVSKTFTELMKTAKEKAAAAEIAASKTAEDMERATEVRAKGDAEWIKFVEEENNKLKKEERTAKAKEGLQALAKLADISATLAPAALDLGKAIAACKVPQSRVDAAVAKLSANSPEWKKLSENMILLTKEKETVFNRLNADIQAVTIAHARLVENENSAWQVRWQRAEAQQYLAPEATIFIQNLAHRARQSLLAQHYEMIAAYLTTVFVQGPKINWSLDSFFEKILDMISQKKVASPGELSVLAKDLEVIFRADLRELARSLPQAYDFHNTETQSVDLVISPDDLNGTAKLLDMLNCGEDLLIDPFKEGLVPLERERAFISKIELLELKFTEEPSAGQEIIELWSGTRAIVRRDGHLYGVRPASRTWTWTRAFGQSNAEIHSGVPPLVSQELLNYLVEGSGMPAFKEKLSLVPAWTALHLRALYKLAHKKGKEKKPVITGLRLRFWIDSLASNRNQCALYVHSSQPDARIECTPVDLLLRKDGRCRIFRTYERDQAVTVKVLPPRDSNLSLLNMLIRTAQGTTKHDESEIKLTMRGDTEIVCKFGLDQAKAP